MDFEVNLGNTRCAMQGEAEVVVLVSGDDSILKMASSDWGKIPSRPRILSMPPGLSSWSARPFLIAIDSFDIYFNDESKNHHNWRY
jgi:hypothetical protein